jgi:hypothetical protein
VTKRQSAAYPSPQLAVLASAAVVAADRFGVLVALFLTPDAQANAGHSQPAGFWNYGVTFRATLETLTARQLVTRTLDSVLDRCVDMVLYRAVYCESACH